MSIVRLKYRTSAPGSISDLFDHARPIHAVQLRLARQGKLASRGDHGNGHAVRRGDMAAEIRQGQYCVVFPEVTIGTGTRLGNFVLIRSHTQIGQGCTIGSYVDIEGDVVIGNHVSLQSSCYITRGVIIEDEVFCGPRVTTMNDRRISYRRPNMKFVRAAPRI